MLSALLSRSVRERVLLLYVASLFVAVVVIGLLFTRTNTAWTMGDWLINYEGGMIRRGLPGEVVWILARWLHASPVLVAYGLCVLVYLSLFLASWRLLQWSSLRLWVLLLAFSPCTLGFPVVDLWAGYHKEILLYALLAGLLVYLGRASGRVNEPEGLLRLGAVLSVACPMLVLSHEPTAVYLPYLLAALVLGLGSWRRALLVAAVPAALSAAAMAVVLAHKGDAHEIAGICASYGGVGSGLCGGAVAYAGVSSAYARGEVTRLAAMYGYWQVYPVATILAVLPLAWGAWRLSRRAYRRELLAVGGLALLAVLGSTELFVYAADWGRWVQMHVFCLFLLLVFLDGRSWRVERRGVRAAAAAPRRHRWQVATAFAVLLVYATCWSLPQYGNRPLFGYVGLPARLLRAKAMRVGVSGLRMRPQYAASCG